MTNMHVNIRPRAHSMKRRWLRCSTIDIDTFNSINVMEKLDASGICVRLFYRPVRTSATVKSTS
jgi:hypothetical protein